MLPATVAPTAPELHAGDGVAAPTHVQLGDQPMPAPCATGIGKYVALDLARRNARTILACRSQERGQVAVEEIRAATGNPAVLLRLLDTSSLASVRTFAQAVLREEKRLDVLVNNAGVTGMCQGQAPGLEQTFATNYLGPFLLTNLLLDLLKASAPARIVNVSSFRHSAGTADSRCLTGQERLSGFDATYNSTKLMNILFTAELAQRLQGTGGSHGAQPCQDCHRSGAQTMQSAWCNSFIKKPCAASADYSQMMSRSSCCFHTACRKLS
uniref:Retinol dehydrogenase 12 n=1 Tax=Falco tinnunculus TaxID=100819 RepID=A0A8C4V5D5_FALTI